LLFVNDIFTSKGDIMAEEKIVEEHTYTETEDGSSESHKRVVEREEEETEPEVTTIVKETIIEED
jgi:hypothetical protein